MFVQVYNNAQRLLPGRRRELTISDTQGNTYMPIVPSRPTTSPTAAGRCRATGRLPVLDSVAADGPTQGALLLFKIQTVSLDNRPLEAQDRRSRRTRPRRARPSSTSNYCRPACRPASSTSRATGAAVSPPAPSLTSSTPTTIRGCSAGAKAANQASVLLASLSAPTQPSRPRLRMPIRSLASAGGARTRSSVPRCRSCRRRRRRGSPPRCRCRLRTTPIIRRRTVRATAALVDAYGRGRGRLEREGRPRAAPAVGDRRGDDAPSAAASPAPDPGRSRSSRHRVRPGCCPAAGSVLSAGARDPGVVVEAEAFGRRHQARRAELHAERREHRVAGDREGELERCRRIPRRWRC